MRTRLIVLLALSALLAFSLSANAQRRGRGGFGRGGGNNPVFLLQNPGVQKELNLSEDQISKIKDVGDKQREKLAALRDMSDEERQEKGPALMKEANEEAQKSLKGLLNADQDKRLHQIMLQAQGPQAFSDAKIQSQLKLTDDQKSSLKTIMDDQRTQMDDIRQAAGGDFRQIGQKMQELRKETMTKITGLLTDEQKAAWKEMTGKTFQIQFQGGRRGRRGGGGAGGA